MELYFWLHRLSLHRRSCFGVKVLFEMTVKYGPPWLEFKFRIGKQKLIRQCHSADSAAFAAWLVWFLPPISCLSQAANPGRRFSRPGVTIAAWRLAAWIRTLTKHAVLLLLTERKLRQLIMVMWGQPNLQADQCGEVGDHALAADPSDTSQDSTACHMHARCQAGKSSQMPRSIIFSSLVLRRSTSLFFFVCVRRTAVELRSIKDVD